MRSLGNGLALAGALLLLGGCGTFPLPKVYVLGDESRPAPGVSDEAGLPHIELKTVTVPDYLDTTGITRRTALNTVTASATGRWGERVSIGVTRALAADLTRRLPNVVIENRGSYEPSRRLLVDVEHFEIGEDGRCTLTARWRMTTSDGKVVVDSRRATFSDAASSNTDAAVAQAMTAAIDQLATEMAVTVRASLGSGAR